MVMPPVSGSRESVQDRRTGADNRRHVARFVHRTHLVFKFLSVICAPHNVVSETAMSQVPDCSNVANAYVDNSEGISHTAGSGSEVQRR